MLVGCKWGHTYYRAEQTSRIDRFSCLHTMFPATNLYPSLHQESLEVQLEYGREPLPRRFS